MDGKRIRNYFSSEVQAILNTFKQFETLIPALDRKGSYHVGEDGRFVEELLREYLKRFLPRNLEVLTGFILRPAVKTGLSNKSRKRASDEHSRQLDIIVYDTSNYPVFQRFGNSAIVPPEGVIAIISVKKTLYLGNIADECNALYHASKLCCCEGKKGKVLRGPFLALVSMQSGMGVQDELKSCFDKIKASYDNIDKENKVINFDNLVGLIAVMNLWSVFKKRPDNSSSGQAKFVGFQHKNVKEEEEHFVLQQILTGILSVFYDETRSNLERPGYTAFPSGRKHDKDLGEINFNKLR